MPRFIAARSGSRALATASALLIVLGMTACPVSAADAATPSHALRVGHSLKPGARLTSLHGRSQVEVARSGAIVRTTAGAMTWSTGTSTSAMRASGSTLHFLRSGRLVLARRGGHVVWRSARLSGAVRLVLADDGALTLVAPGRTLSVIPRATTRTAPPSGAPLVPPAPSLTSPAQLVSEQQLRAGDGLRSLDGRFRLTMQYDGNLVLEGPSGPLWTTKTAVGDDAAVTMQPDGNLVLHDAEDQPRWATRTAIAGSYLVLQDDGDLVVYSLDGRAVWASKTGGRS